MKHIVFYSGGAGSWMTTRRVIEKRGKENIILLFTDTLIEDEDTYRFILDSISNLFGGEVSHLIQRLKALPPITKDMGEFEWSIRKNLLLEIAAAVNEMYKEVNWIADGRTPFDVFKDVRWLGNSRLAQCSHLLKQKPAEKWLKENFKEDECVLYLGIDWSEEHRTKAPAKNWKPYKVEFPMCDQPYLSKQDMLDELTKTGIELPKLYKLNFSHNNCSGMCVRGGQGHWVHLLETMPERYSHVEKFEKEMQEFLEKDVTILSEAKIEKIWIEEKVINYDDLKDKEKDDYWEYGPGDIITIPAHYSNQTVKYNVPLTTLRERYEAGKKEQIDMFDVGGCGCFVQYN